ncbi:hypothetical protein JKF63_06272 [Porcisia hertigi]|uniref:Uncharacterized protein n=1 Tax=Porcisia hertigi TaxID=2761500 RepID=A0A836INI2_9TRYP|nr:hypothetical protein JKF63_06272 [Porcisia hertigi]
MPTTFAEGNDLDSNAAPGVYVNNMNTPHATVSLPERTPRSLHQRNVAPPGSSAPYNASFHAACSNNPYGGQQNNQQVPNVPLGNRFGVGQQSNPVPLTVSGEPVHANLQAVYSRIMRRLQRQMNYAEISRTSLAEQYGVDLQLACEQEEQQLQASEMERQQQQQNTKQPLRTSPTLQAGSTVSPSLANRGASDDSETDTSSQQNRSVSTGPHGSMASTKTAKHDPPRLLVGSTITALPDGGGGVRSASRLVQFKRADAGRQYASALGNTLPSEVSDVSCTTGTRERAAVAAGDDELERDIAAQPCPRPLQLVICHVLDTLLKKMSLAGGGSLKDCIVYTFESRALLERLLKEIPLYSQYRESQGPAGAGAGAGAGKDVMQVYKTLRKRPVFLPRAGYVEDSSTGAIRGQLLVETPAHSKPGPSSHAEPTSTAGVSLPIIANVSKGFNPQGAAAHGTFAGGADELGGVQLPSGYGKSSRLNGEAQQSRTAAFGSSILSHSPSHQVLRDHMTGGSSLDFRDSGYTGNPSATQDSFALTADAASGHSGRVEASPASSPLALSAAHRATCLVSVGTMTDDNSLTLVPKAEYAALQERLERLGVELADAQVHRSSLATQLCEEAQYTNQRKHVLQYLRETLVRECTMLRSQLRTVSGRMNLLQQQHQSHRGVAVSSAATDLRDTSYATIGGTTRAHKHSGVSVAQAPTPSMSWGGHGHRHRTHAQQHPVHRMSFSGGFESLYGGNGGDISGRSGTTQQHTHSGNPPSGTNLPTLSPTAALSVVATSPPAVTTSHYASGAAADGQPLNDVQAIQSLLDLVLLAVEEDVVLPQNTLLAARSGNGDVDIVKSAFHKDAKHQMNALRSEFDKKQHALKKHTLMLNAEHQYLLAKHQDEVNRLRALTDTTQIHTFLKDHISTFRTELRRLRMHVTEQLHFLKAIIHNTTGSLLRRASLVEKTLSENVTLAGTVNAMREMIESAGALLMPMLTSEYRCGYHPWPLKLRNTTDPLAHIIHIRYGAGEVVRLRDSLNVFSKLYSTLHCYIERQIVLPESTRPMTGQPLRYLCGALSLNPLSHTDVIFAARHAYDTDMQLSKRIARLHVRLLWNAHLQRVYTDRSVSALVEGGLNPRQSALPVANRINTLAQERAELLQARLKLQRERSENAKSAYRLWQEKEIDIMWGYPVPKLQRNRLPLLSGTAVGVDKPLAKMMHGQWNPTSRASFSNMLNMHSLGHNGGAGVVSS